MKNSDRAIEVKVGKYLPHTGGGSENSLLACIRNKKSLIDIRASSNCFMYSVLAAVTNTGIHIERPHKYEQFIQSYDFSDVLGGVSFK